MSNGKIFCFAHHDLDGVCTYLVTKWAHPGYTIEYQSITGFDIRKDITEWLLNHNISDYERVFFLDLDMSSVTDLIDYENVILIDHHKSHVDAMKYTKATPIVKEYSSACLLAYKIFRKLYNIQLDEAQKTMVIYGNDYDSYKHEFKESKMLNVIFWNTQKSFDTFANTYANGFVPFTKEQIAIHRIFENELAKTIESLQVFQGGHADEDGEYRVVIATFADKHTNDVADYLLSKYDTDVVVIANLKNKHVSFRRPKNGTMKLQIFAKDVADGGGHEYSAGGKINDAFMEFTKSLKPI